MSVNEELKTYLLVLWRYKWMIAACAIIASVVALVISFQLTPLYSATATLRVASAPGFTDYMSLSSLYQLRNTYIEIATNDISLSEVAKRLGLQKLPSVQVDVVPETELIRISASDPDPARAHDIANTLASLMIEQSQKLRAIVITVVEPAYLPRNPGTPRVPLNTALGLLAGLATGVILAFLFEGMDDTLRGIEDVQTITTLPILCMVPELKRRLGSNANLDFSRNGNPSLAPAFDQLRVRLILSDAKPKSATFLVTSPEPGAGKSTVATNLAVSLAEGGDRVVLIDMDFRRPRIHSVFGLTNGKGLSDFVRGEIQLNATLHATTLPNLRVVTAGSSPDVPSEWLTPVKIGSLLESLDKECDYVLIDAPALLCVADSTVLASQADAVIMVVARRKTARKNLRFALQQLAELKTEVTGIVVNRVPYSKLYSYYSDRPWKQILLRRGKSTRRIIADAQRKRSGLDKE